MRRWAIERCEFANLHFRHADKGKFMDAPYIPEDFLGTAEPPRKQRTAEMLASRHEAERENLRVAREKRRPTGGGSSKIVDGKVVVMGQPNVFARLAEQHEASKRKGKRG